jgi:hypothetical protein
MDEAKLESVDPGTPVTSALPKVQSSGYVPSRLLPAPTNMDFESSGK